MNYLDSIFKWEKDHFTLLPLEESEKFLSDKIAKDKKITLQEWKKIDPNKENVEEIFKSHAKYQGSKDGKIKIPYGVMENMLDLLSEKEGWKHYSENMFGYEAKILWNGTEINISTIQNDKSFKIVINSPLFKNETSSIDFEYKSNEKQINRSDYQKELNKKDQHGHKK